LTDTVKLLWANTDILLLITDADTVIFALHKPQLKDIAVHFFSSACRPHKYLYFTHYLMQSEGCTP